MRILPLLAALTFCAPVLAGPNDVVRSYPAQKVHAGTYVIHGPQGVPSVENQSFMNNPVWILTADGVVVIDPGSSVQAGRMVMAQLRKTTKKPVTHVFNTHVHGDHWLGNLAVLDVWPKATIIGHPDMIKQAKNDIALLVAEQGRRENCTARYGGDEFALLLAETALSGALIFAERVRAAIDTEAFGTGAARIEITASIGAAEWNPAMRRPEDLIAVADAALYRAKHAGRNRIASPEPR